MGFLPNRLLEFQNKPSLFVAFQLCAAQTCLWQTKGKKSGSIRRPEKTNPGDSVLVYNIVSDQPSQIPQMPGLITSQSLWRCKTFVNHVGDYIYIHLMRDLYLFETLLAKEALEKLMRQARQTFKHYHANNGSFSEMVSLMPLIRKIKR